MKTYSCFEKPMTVFGVPFFEEKKMFERVPEELREKLKEVIADFKAQEPFFRNACARVIADTNKVLAIQYETDDEVKVVVYTGSPMTQTGMTVYPMLDGKFSFDGKEYDGNGICIEMPMSRNTYIFTLRRIK